LAPRRIEGAEVVERNSGRCGSSLFFGSSLLFGSGFVFGSKLGHHPIDLGQSQDLFGLCRPSVFDGRFCRLDQLVKGLGDSVQTGSHRIEAITLRLFEMLKNGIVSVHATSKLRTLTIIASKAFFRQAIDFTNDPRPERHLPTIESENESEKMNEFFEIVVFDIVTNGGFC
jgi:hypothetical protein